VASGEKDEAGSGITSVRIVHMKNRVAWMLAVFATLVAGALHSAEIDPRLAPLQPLVGKTWRGELSAPGAAKSVVDVHRFELALNGRAVRSLHSVNDGEYGGETLFVWDDEKKSVVYTYFTTAGFYTTGTMQLEGGALHSHEIVRGATSGVREVKATSRVLPDGRLHVKSQLLKDGQWVDGHEVHYTEDPKAVVRFKD
jgi:hypothetical protein